MAVQAVKKVTGTETQVQSQPSQEVSNTDKVAISQETLSKMTAAEIVKGYKSQNWDVPEAILKWSEEEYNKNPESKTTYGEAQASGKGESPDVISYKEMLGDDGLGLSLKEQCKILTSISATMENNDLSNVTKMAPYIQQVPADKTTGNNGESEVQKAFFDITKDMIKNSGPMLGGKDFKEGLKFFDALQKGTSNELVEIDSSLEEISNVINGTINDAKQSKATGTETLLAGVELKSKTSWWQFFGTRRKAAKSAIEQGDKTVKMSDRTDKLAQAIAKDNNIALNSVKENINAVEEAKLDENGNPIEGTESSNKETNSENVQAKTPETPETTTTNANAGSTKVA